MRCWWSARRCQRGIAGVSKSGTVKALKKGSAVVRAKVVLKNGKTKVVKVKFTVK